MAFKDNLNDCLPLPADSMPECWSRDERMNALFAEFRNRAVNSQDWDSKYKFWEKFISDWLSWHKRCSFSVSDLRIAFKRNGCTPLCLRTVVEELLRNGEIISMMEFLKESSGSWTAWAIDTMVKRPLIWSFSKLKNYVVKDVVNDDTDYVHIKTLKELANLILTTVDEDSNNVLMSVSQVTKNCIKKSGNSNITERNVKMALLWLRKTDRAAFKNDILQSNGEFLIKISPDRVKEVTDAELGLFRLLEQEKLIIKNIENLETEKKAILTKAKASLAGNMRELAKTCLRKKREIDQSIEKRAAALSNVQTLIARIHDANSNTEILAAYKTGGEILKNFENTGLSEDNAVNTMDDISDAVSELAEVQNIISASLGPSDTDLELEKELQELLDIPSDKTTPKSKVESNFGDLPDLQKELQDLNFDDLPPPPQTNLGIDSFDASHEKVKPT